MLQHVDNILTCWSHRCAERCIFSIWKNVAIRPLQQRMCNQLLVFQT